MAWKTLKCGCMSVWNEKMRKTEYQRIGNCLKHKDNQMSEYLYCKTCRTFFDFYKYDYSLEQAGHEECKIREVTKEELNECIKECAEIGCGKE